MLLAGLAAPILSMHTTNPELRDAPQNSSIRVAQRAIDAAFPGANDTAELVVSGHQLGTAAGTGPAAAARRDAGSG